MKNLGNLWADLAVAGDVPSYPAPPPAQASAGPISRPAPSCSPSSSTARHALTAAHAATGPTSACTDGRHWTSTTWSLGRSPGPAQPPMAYAWRMPNATDQPAPASVTRCGRPGDARPPAARGGDILPTSAHGIGPARHDRPTRSGAPPSKLRRACNSTAIPIPDQRHSCPQSTIARTSDHPADHPAIMALTCANVQRRCPFFYAGAS